MGYSASDFTSIDSLTAKYEKESKNLTFKCKIGEKEFTYIASQFGNSKIEELSKLSPSVLRAYTPDTSLSNAREKMFENNYIQNIYLFGEEESGYTGYYIFNAHYFGQVYYSNPGYLSGYISLHTEEVKDGDDPHPAKHTVSITTQRSRLIIFFILFPPLIILCIMCCQRNTNPLLSPL